MMSSDDKREVESVPSSYASDAGKMESGRELAGSTDAILGSAKFWRKAASWGIEGRGILPVLEKDRTDTHFISILTIWSTMSFSMLPIVSGMLGTVSFGLGLRDAALVIIFFSLLTIIPPAYLCTLGPKTGLRQMIQARYSFGYFGVSLPVLLNLATLVGFCIINSVIGGQTLSAVSDGRLSLNVGIVVVAVVSLLVSFAGYRILHYYDRFAWIPVFIAILVALGCGGSHLKNQSEAPVATASAVLSFGGYIAGYMIPYGGIASDFSTYMTPTAPSWRIFLYTFLGLFVPSVPLMILGAAIGGSFANVPAWQAGYEAASAGGVLAAMLHPAGGFGKFLVVLLALSVIGNVTGTFYAITLNFQTLLPFARKVPRAMYAIVVTAIVIPISIEAAKSFLASLENFLGVVGYWSAAFVAIVMVEHICFRKRDGTTYDPAVYNDWKSLTHGFAAIAAGCLPFALVIPCMSQIWYTGPIGRKTGDLGFEVAFVLAGLFYLPLRSLEIRWRGHL